MKDTTSSTYCRTALYNLDYYIIWGAKYRNGILKQNVEVMLKRMMYEITERYGLESTTGNW
ncbi:transposase [Lacticaseibacillus suilingensis]|uniref:Transposase n=1 Tax=Lacticaseibacillus suilingensis TaxID=2799577 RepID=A0ABW4BCC7_9LACO